MKTTNRQLDTAIINVLAHLPTGASRSVSDIAAALVAIGINVADKRVAAALSRIADWEII